MKRAALVVTLMMAGSVMLGARPAQAIRLDLGIGSFLGRSGVYTGFNYRLGRWSDRFGAQVYLDAGRYVNKRRKSDDRRTRDKERRGRENVALKVSPGDSWVFLNGVLVDADGKDRLQLPPGKYRLEFVRPGHRTEVAELDVQEGVSYEVERKLHRLQPGEQLDPRLTQGPLPVSVEEAIRRTRTSQPEAVPAPEARSEKPGAPAVDVNEDARK